jgi:RimJ/RimL family protein N-acetyltransferase
VAHDRDAGAAFELQPTLTGSLLELRPLRAGDFDALFEAASDPLIWEQHPEPDRHERGTFQRYFDGAIESRGAFAVVDRSSGRIIGSTRFCNLDPVESEVEIGWTFLERAYWGGAYNRDMKSLMLAHAFRFVTRVVFVVGEGNLRSRKALAKIGARVLRRGHRPGPDGRPASFVVFEIRAPESRALSRLPEGA